MRRGYPIQSRLPHIAAFWTSTVERLPNAGACIYAGRSHTFGQVDAVVARLAAHLRDACGVRKGDRVAIALPNCGAYLPAYWATLRLGAVVVPVNIKLRDEELAFVFSNCDPSAVLVHEQVQDVVETALRSGGVAPSVIRVAADRDGVEFMDLGDDAPGADVPDDLSGEDIAIVLYTSGTTGQPKGAIMRHCDLLFNVRNAILAHSFRHEDTHLLAIPFFAPTASYSLLPTCAYLGSPVVIAPQPNPTELLELIGSHRCTTFIGVPTLFHLLTGHPHLQEADLTSLRLVAYSGSPMPARTIRALRTRLPNASLHNFFGLTETISMTHVLPSRDAVDRADSIGIALPEVFARVVDEEGNDVPWGETGELCFHRSNIISGYWRQEQRLEEAIRGEWFFTGDFASRDEAGYFYVRGRKKEMIIVAGQNVYALEVEAVILRHPDVCEVAVVGVEATGARAALGELVKAVIVPQPDAQLSELDIKRHCSGHLPSYKVPQIVIFVSALPRNAAGKVLKRELH